MLKLQGKVLKSISQRIEGGNKDEDEEKEKKGQKKKSGWLI